METFWIAKEQKEQLYQSEKRKVILVGGFSGYWNLGDFLQLKSVLRIFQKEYLPLIFIDINTVKNLDDLNILKQTLPDSIFIFSSNKEHLNSNIEVEKIENTSIDTLHLYGGGFLNEYWGKIIIGTVENALNTFKPKRYLISGQQISSKVIDSFKHHVSIYKPDLVGVRDEESLSNLKKNGIKCEFSWDDSIEELLNIKNILSEKKKGKKTDYNYFGMHINLSDYVINSLHTVKQQISYILKNLKDNRPVFFQSYNRKSTIVKDTIKSIEYLNLGYLIQQLEVLDLMSSVAFHKFNALKRYIPKIGPVFSSSYHTALFFMVLNKPVYLFCFNSYYTQKHKSLMGDVVQLEEFIENIDYHWDIQQKLLSRRIKQRKNFVNILKNTLSSKNTFRTLKESLYTYSTWPVEKRDINEIDEYAVMLNKTIDEFKYYSENLRLQLDKTYKELVSKENLLVKQQEIIEELKSENSIISSKNIELRNKIKEIYRQLREKEYQLSVTQQQLNDIFNSNSWRLLSFYFKLRDNSIFKYIIKPVRFIALKILTSIRRFK